VGRCHPRSETEIFPHLHTGLLPWLTRPLAVQWWSGQHRCVVNEPPNGQWAGLAMGLGPGCSAYVWWSRAAPPPPPPCKTPGALLLVIAELLRPIHTHLCSSMCVSLPNHQHAHSTHRLSRRCPVVRSQAPPPACCWPAPSPPLPPPTQSLAWVVTPRQQLMSTPRTRCVRWRWVLGPLGPWGVSLCWICVGCIWVGNSTKLGDLFASVFRQQQQQQHQQPR